MKILPALFNTEMVRAILDGQKTVTRRVVKFPRNRFTGKIPLSGEMTLQNFNGSEAFFAQEPFYGGNIKTPYCAHDILYVRETWAAWSRTEGLVPAIHYKADGENLQGVKWRPSIHMPREVARIFLRVTNVRVERLQEIECISKEGITMIPADNDRDPRFYFIQLWDSTIKPADRDICGWAANPWVWVIEFERISREEAYTNG